MRKTLYVAVNACVLAVLLLLVGATPESGAQSGPYSAQIQRALRSFLSTAQTVTGSWTFTGPVVLPSGTTAKFGATATATVGGVLTTSTTQVCTTAVTTEENLWTYSLPAGSLDSDGRGLRITAWWSTAATATTKQARLYFGTVQSDTGARASNNGSGKIQMVVLRSSATTQQVFSEWAERTVLTMTMLPIASGTETLANAITLRFSITNGTAAANEGCFRGAVVETLR